MPVSRKRSPSAKRENRVMACRRRAPKQVHDVELDPDTPKTRQQSQVARRRKGFVLGVWLLLTFCLIALGASVWRQAFHRNPLYGLKEVTVLTEGALTPERIVKTLGLTMGMDTLLMNHRKQRTLLEALPEVRKAHVQKDLEGGMTITVEQRHPVAWLECENLGLLARRTGFGCLLDAEGVAIPCRVILKEYLSLPVIRYDELSQVHPGAVVPDLQIQASLRLLKDLGGRITAEMTGIESIDVPTKYALQVHFRGGMQVTFGPDRLDTQLPRFDRVMREAQKQGWQVATLDLLPRHNVPITFAPQSSVAQHNP